MCLAKTSMIFKVSLFYLENYQQRCLSYKLTYSEWVKLVLILLTLKLKQTLHAKHGGHMCGMSAYLECNSLYCITAVHKV